jgi:hypothetical protein
VSDARVERLALDVDTRLVGLWALVDQVKVWDLDIAAMYMRSAYAQGYCDALSEDVRGRLHRENGYRVPARSET